MDIVQDNKIITLINKDFRHEIVLKDDIYKIDYQVKDFKLSSYIVGNGRLLVIYGSYSLYWKPLYIDKAEYNIMDKSFKEIIYIADLKLDYDNIRVESNLKGIPRLFKSNHLNNCAFLIGEICCKLYKIDLKDEITTKEIVKKSTLDGEDESGTLFSEDKSAISPVFEEDREEVNDRPKNIICISSTRWGFLWQRPHHLMDRLSKKNNRVLFFDHSVTMDYIDIQRILLNTELWSKRLDKVSDNLWIFSSVHLPVEQVSLLKNRLSLEDFNYKIKEDALKFLIKKLNFEDPIIISYLAESVNYLKNIPSKLLCYDCVDNFSGFSWTDKDLEEDEKELIREADIVITTAENLFNRIRKLHSQTYLLPNAVDFDHFAISDINNKQLRFKSNPVVGFIGAFYEWIDEGLLEYLARSRQNWQFYFVGPIQSGMGKKIINLANVKFFGSKEYEILPEFLAKMDVCIIPFKLNKITANANPIKLWEYLASGLPIVSTPIPEVKKFDNLIYLADSKEDFLLKIDRALKEDSADKKAERINIARKNDWNFRVDELLKVINQNLKNKSKS